MFGPELITLTGEQRRFNDDVLLGESNTLSESVPKQLVLRQPQRMGFSLFETPWEVPLAKLVFQDTGDPALKSFFGAQGWNTSLIDNLNKFYNDTQTGVLLPGADPVLYMSANAGVSEAVVNSFLKNRTDPSVKNQSEILGLNLTPLFWIAGLGLTAYILTQLKVFVPMKE
jgi:hypothetical protein